MYRGKAASKLDKKYKSLTDFPSEFKSTQSDYYEPVGLALKPSTPNHYAKRLAHNHSMSTDYNYINN